MTLVNKVKKKENIMADAIDHAVVHTEKELIIRLAQVRYAIPTGESLMECEECGQLIPKGRRKAMPGVRTCVACQEKREN